MTGRMKPTCAAALAVLRAAEVGWVSGNRIGEVAGWRFGGRLHELRHRYGYTIERRSAPNGNRTDEYRLVENPEQLAMAI